MKKILNQKILQHIKNKKKKIVLCHGVFDLLHPGHLFHFEDAKKNGDVLIVSITSDKFINKGPNKPVFNENIRLKFVSSIECVDYVILSKSYSSSEIIDYIKPNIYCKGSDFSSFRGDITGKIFEEKKMVEKNGGKLIITKTEKFSSSKMLNQYFNVFDKNQDIEIKNIKQKFNFNDVQSILNNTNKTKINLIGEIIFDEYVFCETMGKSGKEPILILKKIAKERYLGGIGSIANNLSTFVKKINIFSSQGISRKERFYLKQKINKNIELNTIITENRNNIIKTRFIDNYEKKKIIGVYEVDDKLLNIKEERQFLKKIKSKISNNPIIISDYGHGLMTKKITAYLSKVKNFTAVNAQINSSSLGYHNLLQYKNMDLVVVNEKEIRYEMRNRDASINDLMKKLKTSLNCRYLVVTRGDKGILALHNKKFYFSNPYADKVIDRVGAGDSVLFLLSILIFNKVPLELSLFLASISASINIKNLINKKNISKNELLKSIQHMIG